MDYVSIGKRIQHIRKKILKLTREEFAELLNTNFTSIGRLERGQIKTLDLTLIDKISVESGYSIDEIVHGFNNCNKNSLIKKINYLLEGLTEKQLKYQFEIIHEFTKLIYSGDIRTLKDIKKDINKN